MARTSTSPIERMLARKVVDEEGCWVWPGATDDRRSGFGGYGVINIGGHRTRRVHVLSFEHFVGPVPEGFEVDHLCHTIACRDGVDCKHRLCWNPEHLQAKSHAANQARGKAPGALAVATGWCQRGLHSRTPENLITRIRKSGTVATQCRPCHNETQRLRLTARRAG